MPIGAAWVAANATQYRRLRDGTLSGVAPAAVTRTGPSSAVRRAGEFTDSVGVGTHLTYPAYSNLTQVLTALDYLGLKHIRDGWGSGRDSLAAWVANNLRPRGIKLCMVHDNRDWAPNSITTEIAGTTMLNEHKRTGLINDIAIAEGPNEYDAQRGGTPTWATLHRNLVQRVSAAYRGDATAQALGIKVASGSWADTNTASLYTAVGNLGSYVDYITFHPYPGSDFMMNDTILNTMGNNARVIAPTAAGTPVPVIATEHAFSNGTVGAPYPAMPVAQQTAQTLRVYLEDFRGIGAGGSAVDVARTYKYELVDQGTDNAFENSFGLFTNAWAPKATATALRNLLTLLSDTASNAMTFAAVGLGHTLAGNSATRSLLMQKADGTWWLALWQQETTWNGTSVVSRTPITATLTLPASRVVTSYNPQTGTTGTALGTGTSFSVTSSTDVTVLRIV